MRTLSIIRSILLCALAGMLVVGCSNVSIPPAKGYMVHSGGAQFAAKSVKLHGSWAEFETASGNTVWANSAMITVLRDEPHPAQAGR